MKFIDEYRQSDLAIMVAEKIAGLTKQSLKLMEVCGGHTHTIFKYGIEDLLPENIEMIHGPGCPVCVIPLGRVDDAISIAQQPGSFSLPLVTRCVCLVQRSVSWKQKRLAPTCAWSIHRSMR
jgi:hydrogenase expression/formation protein HypD